MLEGRHVIGLFLLMLLFSAVFFSLGYVMARNQYAGQVRAEAGKTEFWKRRYLRSRKLRRSTGRARRARQIRRVHRARQVRRVQLARPAQRRWRFPIGSNFPPRRSRNRVKVI